MVAPDLDKLIKLHEIFDVTLDELILGEKEEVEEEIEPSPVVTPPSLPSHNQQQSILHIIGFAMLLCGMLMFLISVFFGSTLSFSEEIGELTSMMIVLVGLFILAPFNTIVVSICGIVYVLYCVICYAILDLTSIANGIFLSFSSVLILVWFIVCGLHANRTQSKK